ncbi:Z1 domain-containing protein [Nocardia sp. NPDC004582]
MAKQVGALGPTGIRLSQRVQDLRVARGLTLATLARRMGELGRPIDLSTLGKLEKGQRRVDVDDLVALALALEVSPNGLLLPDTASGDRIDLTERFRVTSSEAWKWAVGDQPTDPLSLALQRHEPSKSSTARSALPLPHNERADHRDLVIATATQIRMTLHHTLLADMAVTKPKRLERAMDYHAEDIAGAWQYATENDLQWFLQSASPDDPLIAAWRKQLATWDLSDNPSWSQSEPRTQQRRADLYDRLALSPETRKRFNEACPIAEALGSVLIDTVFEPWYTPHSQLQRAWYWPRYRELLANKGWPTTAVHRLDLATDAIVERLADPTRPHAYQSKGLVVGYVQSGKTSQFTGVIAKAMDAGYRLVIVLEGAWNLLREQTQRRLDQDLVGRENILRGVSEYESDYCDDPSWLHGQFIEFGGMPSTLGGFDIVRLTTRHSDYNSLPPGSSALEFDKQQPELPLYDDRNLHRSAARLMVIKKNKTILTKLVHDLRHLQTLHEIPALIIDDESDGATIDTARLASDSEPGTISNLIGQLLEILPRAQYVGYTATPFAKVFIDPQANAETFPKDFILSLPRPEGYMGASDFHDFGTAGSQHERTVANSNELAYVRDVDVDRDDDTQQLERALDTFVLTGAMKLFREDRDGLGEGHFRHHTMLVHESHRIEDHRELLGRIAKLWWQAGYSSSRGHERLRDLFDADIAPVSAVRAEGYAVPVSFDELMPYIGPAVARVGADQKPIVIVDSGSDINTGDIDFDRRTVWKILLAGPKLTRSFTIEGLTVSYVRHRAPAASAMSQMGRWFGFRRGYRDLVRLYISREDTPGTRGGDLYRTFESMCEDEEALRAELAHESTTLYGGQPLTPDKVPQLLARHVSLRQSLTSHPTAT